MIINQKETIKNRAKAVNYSDGISKEEARALVEVYLLNAYPQFLGWNIKIEDNEKNWRAVCRFLETHKLDIDKTSGLVLEDIKLDSYRILKTNEQFK